MNFLLKLTKGVEMLPRILLFAYGVSSYLMFLGVFLFAVCFIGNFGVPNSIDAEPNMSTLAAVGVNSLLLTVFAIQHSGMARPTFKRWWTRIIPKPIERSTYVLFSNIAMIGLFLFWQPIGGVVWEIPGELGRAICYAMYGVGWAIVFYSTCLLNHFELFGLRQVYLHLCGRPYTPLPFKEPSLYKHVRHPIYVGWLMVFWFAPTMTTAHLLFAVVTTAYILIAIQWEERNLEEALSEYADYKMRVPMLVPNVRTLTTPAESDSRVPAQTI